MSRSPIGTISSTSHTLGGSQDRSGGGLRVFDYDVPPPVYGSFPTATFSENSASARTSPPDTVEQARALGVFTGYNACAFYWVPTDAGGVDMASADFEAWVINDNGDTVRLPVDLSAVPPNEERYIKGVGRRQLLILFTAANGVSSAGTFTIKTSPL